MIDTNIIVSGLLFDNSVPAQALIHASGQGKLLISEELAIELIDVLYRSRFNSYVSREEREEFLNALLSQSEVVEITESVRVLS